LANFQLLGSLLILLLVGLGALAMLQMGLKNVALNLFYAVRDRLLSGRSPKAVGSLPMHDSATSRPAVNPAEDPGARSTTYDEVSRRLKAVDRSASLDANDLVERIRQRRRELEAIESGGDGDESAAEEIPAARTPEPDRDGLKESISQAELADIRAESAPRQTSAAAASDMPLSPVVTTARPAPRPAPKKNAPARRGGVATSYTLPHVTVLDDSPERSDSAYQAETEDTSKLIEETFAEFNINIKVVTATRGPVITQYELELKDAGMRVSKVEGFEKDLSLKLGTEGIRIVAPLPNKKTIGIEVPNQLKEPVVMRDLVEETDADKITLPLVLGRDVLGQPMVGDLAKMPHLLVAGATGMGKSVCMNAMICSVLLFRDPEEVKFIMVDPKMVELAGYEDIPHLLTPPITDMSKAHAALEWACTTMDERYYALRMVGVRNISDYNKLGEAEIRKRLEKKGKDLEALPGIDVRMPYIIIVVDEYADLMMVNKEVEKAIVRLTAKSRACGIHIILTTQRPSADVVTGLIKSNLPARISFRVADKNNSRVVLDAGGAENLLGKGDMLYLPPGSSSLVRGQGVWVKDHEIDAIIDHAKSQGEPEYDENIFKVGAVAMAGNGVAAGEESTEWVNDKQFHESVWAMYKYNKTGADFLRRKMQIGYNKATAYVEQLEDLGFLGPQKGTKSREFLKSWDDWLDELKVHDVDVDPEMFDCYTNPFS
jgi:S-DNA-T family DNA segregation ATPase FtsK/SpoIIIE